MYARGEHSGVWCRGSNFLDLYLQEDSVRADAFSGFMHINEIIVCTKNYKNGTLIINLSTSLIACKQIKWSMTIKKLLIKFAHVDVILHRTSTIIPSVNNDLNLLVFYASSAFKEPISCLYTFLKLLLHGFIVIKLVLFLKCMGMIEPRLQIDKRLITALR